MNTCYYLNQWRGTNRLFLLHDEDLGEFATAVASHIANEQVEATLYEK